jgi:hypothetical protein
MAWSIARVHFRAMAWAEVESCPEVEHVPSFMLEELERIGDTCADGGPDFMMKQVDEWTVEVSRGLARIERADDGRPAVYMRTKEGEYRAFICGVPDAVGPEMKMPDSFSVMSDGPPFAVSKGVADVHAVGLRWHAALLQRQRATRAEAALLPVSAFATSLMSGAGRTSQQRADVMRSRVREARVDRPIVEGRQRDMVTVELAVPRGRGARLKMVADAGVFPEFREVPRAQLAQAVGTELARRISPRGVQAMMAGLSLIFSTNGLELDEDGKVPKRFRLDVMDMIGMPSARASKAQRDMVADTLALLVDAEVQVTSRHGRRTEYIPLLTKHAFMDAPSAPERRATRVRVNEVLLPENTAGRLMRLPRPLLRIPDEDDGAGTLRMLGFRAAFRLCMGTEGTERLTAFARAAGVEEWMRRTAEHDGMAAVLTELRRNLDRLRSLGGEDIVGGMTIVGDTLDDAVVEYRQPPAWADSSPKGGVSDMTRHVATNEP